MSTHGGAREGAGRKPGPQLHLRDPESRVHGIHVSVTSRELHKLTRNKKSKKSLALRLYEYAKKGGL